MSDLTNLKAACGHCGADVHFWTCRIDGCEWAIASECLGCGIVHPIKHPPRCSDESEATA